MNQPYDINPANARPAKRPRKKSGRLGALAIVLALALGLGGDQAAAQSPAVTEAQAIAYAHQLEAARALEARAYQTQSAADYRAAAAALDACSRVHPDDLLLHRSLGYLYLEKLNQPDLAFAHLQTVYAATPEAPGWGRMLAKAAGATGRTDLQIQVLNDVAKREPQDPWCRLDQANALNKAGRFVEADQAFQDAIKIAPDEEGINISYAWFLKARGRTSEAGQIARKVLATNPKSAPALTFFANERAAAQAPAATDAQTSKARALEARAYKTHSAADYRAAAAALEDCSRRHPKDLLLHRSLGYLYLEKLHQPELALPHLQAVYAATPEAPGWGRMLAKAAGATGRTDLQIHVLNDVAKREPRDPWCRLDLANALNKAGRFVEADQAFRDAIEVAPHEEWVNISYAQFLLSRGRTSEAERVARKVLATHPKSAPALTLLGDIQRNNSDFTGARAEYAQARIADPSYSGVAVGSSELQRSESPLLKSSGYVFQGTDHFFQSGLYNTLTVPVQDHLYLNAAFNTGWFHKRDSGFPSATRYGEGLGLEYRLNSTLSFAGGMTGFEVGDHTVVGFNVGATWRPAPGFWMYGYYRFADPVNDSIFTVDAPLSQNVGGLDCGYQITDDLYASINTSRANYSDGNVRNFIHLEPATYMLWRPAQLQIGPVYEVTDYSFETPNYSSPSWFQLYGPMIEAEPSLNEWLSFKARCEVATASDASKWGVILSAGPSVHIDDTFAFTVEYLFYNAPTPFTSYSGNGCQASLLYRF